VGQSLSAFVKSHVCVRYGITLLFWMDGLNLGTLGKSMTVATVSVFSLRVYEVNLMLIVHNSHRMMEMLPSLSHLHMNSGVRKAKSVSPYAYAAKALNSIQLTLSIWARRWAPHTTCRLDK